MVNFILLNNYLLDIYFVSEWSFIKLKKLLYNFASSFCNNYINKTSRASNTKKISIHDITFPF